MSDYNRIAETLASELFRKMVEALHRDYYEEWRRETDPAARAHVAAKADCLDDVLTSMTLLAGESDASE